MSNCLCQDRSTHPGGKDSRPVWRTGASPRQDISPHSHSGIALNFGLLSCSSRQLLDREEPSVTVETMHLLSGSQLKSLLHERISRLSKTSDQSDYKMRVRWIREVYAVRCGWLNIPETAKHRWLMTNRQHTVPLKNAVPPVPVPVMTILQLDNTWFFLWIWGVTTMICCYQHSDLIAVTDHIVPVISRMVFETRHLVSYKQTLQHAPYTLTPPGSCPTNLTNFCLHSEFIWLIIAA